MGKIQLHKEKPYKMKTTYKISTLLFLVIASLTSCNSKNDKSDAYGNFEAVEYMISAENTGKILYLDIKEGDTFTQATRVGLIDTVPLYLQKEQLIAKKKSIASGIQSMQSRIAVYKEQLTTLAKEKNRIDKMFSAGAATQQNVDDVNGRISVIEKQIQSVKTENEKIFAELDFIKYQIQSIQNNIDKSSVFVPKASTVIATYKEAFEMATMGMPLFKLADLTTLDLKAYISGAQLPQIKIGQKVEVIIDENAKENQSLEGVITWISSNSEFTPKIIQTKEERVKLVYAIKVKVVNDGRLKIGMPAEVKF